MLRRLIVSLPVFLGLAVLGAAQSGGAGQLTPPAGNTSPEKQCVIAGHVANALTGEPVDSALG